MASHTIGQDCIRYDKKFEENLRPVESSSLVPGMLRVVEDRRAPAWHRLKAFFILMQNDRDDEDDDNDGVNEGDDAADAEADAGTARAGIERREHWAACAKSEIARCREDYRGESGDGARIDLLETHVDCEIALLRREREALDEVRAVKGAEKGKEKEDGGKAE